ncbi:CinA family nicotinamide mononucleotide deamidase-related protein [Ignatzschineria rhizosphaerae]|uniref:CinA-like protein n=1 Tax=Ignatzschineria rhizosphaerae TaxID=2923279 RepID=A0ABY3WWC1_9GAMM|nr:CinA family nicotinamide mononucleotide deamidase-related protein [Ignatzschineria rhizosphaerae]UNM94933.1 CinA family nicotinamide mononucleotide deamidase-related protein [Ignatzschineria rhizosphaerae]
MKAEIIVSGSELLLGQSIDTNGPWIARKLSEIGIDCHFKSTVGDNLNNMAETFSKAMTRADIILCTGGLGPTQDDITRDALAKALNLPLIYDEALAEKIREKFKARNRAMSDNNLRQAYYPENATILDAFPGTAPGIYLQHQGKHLFLMPGVPSEMKVMMEEDIIPLLTSLLPNIERIYTKTLRCWGKGESDISALLAEINDELDHLPNPKLSFLASGIEGIQVRFSAKTATESEAMTLIEPFATRAKALLGNLFFGEDDVSMEATVAKMLDQKTLTLGLYESFSEGMIATRLNEKSQTQYFFKGAWVESRERDLSVEAYKTKLYYIQTLSHADIVTTVHGEEISKNNLQLTLLLQHHDQLYEKSMIIPYFNHQAAVSFSVINLLNMVRLYLVGALESDDSTISP